VTGTGLVVERLSVRYPGRREPALVDASLVAGPGDVVAVAGRTGAGKSTLALASAGFIPRVVRARTDGVARVDGVVATDAAVRAADLAGRAGIVFSTPANQLSASKLTVREELAFGLENLAVPRDAMDERIDAVLDRLGIGHLADREPFALSGGEQQRVAIASIVAMGAGLLVLDEPTAQLDPAGTRQVRELLAGEAAAGRAILVAEHDPTVLAVAARCLLLDAGRTVTLDRPAVALGSAVLRPLGIDPPTLIAFAELAGLGPEDAFDEEAIASALGRRRGSGPGPQPASTGHAVGSADGPRWEPLRDQPPVDIELSSVTFGYPSGVEALRGVDLAIRAGEAVAVVGQNGSGKTTLVKHLDGLLRPAQGIVRVGGRDIANVPVNEVARTVGFVFQNPDEQLFNRSVEREVGFGPRNLGLPEGVARSLVDRALGLAGLASERNTNPYDLGLATRKLVALASVLAMEPAVLVLDEPTTGQDGPGVARVGAIVDAHRAAGRTVIAITHDMGFAAQFDRIVVMRQGAIALDGPPALVFDPGQAALLASTGLVPPPAARIGARIGLGSTPTVAALLSAIGSLPGA
jgi:energy-coupling factor transport system ATP-binding protein